MSEPIKKFRILRCAAYSPQIAVHFTSREARDEAAIRWASITECKVVKEFWSEDNDQGPDNCGWGADGVENFA